MTDPTPEEIQRVQAYLKQQREASAEEARREREAAKERFNATLRELFEGRQIAQISADESSYGGTTIWTTYGLVMVLDNGAKLRFEAEWDGRAVEVYVEEPTPDA